MKINVNSFSEKFQVAMGKFSTNMIVMTIANGMIKLLPITMVGSICAILSNLGIPGYQDFIDSAGITPIIKLGTTMTTNLITVYVLVSLSIEMAKMLKSDTISAVLISFISFFIVTPIGSFDIKDGKVSAFDISYLGSKGMFVAMIVALLCTYSYYFLTKKKITIKLPDNVPPTVATSFAALLPAMIIGAVTILIAGFISFTSFGNVHDFIYQLLQTPLQKLGGSIWALLFLMFFSEVLWFFGIHGSLATSAILYALYQPLELQNLAAFSAGQHLPNILEVVNVL